MRFFQWWWKRHRDEMRPEPLLVEDHELQEMKQWHDDTAERLRIMEVEINVTRRHQRGKE